VVEVEGMPLHAISTVQVVEEQLVVGTPPEMKPVPQYTSQFVMEVAVLQGADVILG
jgi:hypothetical protein